MSRPLACLGVFLFVFAAGSGQPRSPALELAWNDDYLTISGRDLPGGSIRIHYLEAYCRPGSTARDWYATVIGHRTRIVEAAPDKSRIDLECRLNDGVVVRHRITAGEDTVDFRITARNPTDETSQAHWAQPCVRVDRFVGVEPVRGQESYLARSFVFDRAAADAPPVRTFLDAWTPWARSARYTPGQVWAGPGVPRDDVNPRPLNPRDTANGLIGCVSADGRKMLAMAWEPWQELFQGVIVCLHSDFRIGGLQPGETKEIRGKIYVIDNDPQLLLKRYQQDFPDQAKID